MLRYASDGGALHAIRATLLLMVYAAFCAHESAIEFARALLYTPTV